MGDASYYTGLIFKENDLQDNGMVLCQADNLKIAKSFDTRQPARTAQADVGETFRKCTKPPFHRARFKRSNILPITVIFTAIGPL